LLDIILILKLLYNIGIRSYSLSVLTAGIFGNKKAVDWVEGRKNWKEYLQKFRDLNNASKTVWIHASSLGEFEQVKPLIEELKKQYSSNEISVLVTFFSPSGYNYAKDYTFAEGVMYLPIDTVANAKFFLDTLRPDIAIFVKYDFWFNFLKQLQIKKIPIIYFSSKFRSGQFYFKSGMQWQLEIMKKIDVIQTHDSQSYDLLKEKGFTNVSIGGDTRFDKVYQTKNNFLEIDLVHRFKKDKSLFILGSSWPPEEKIVSTVQKGVLDLGFKICVAPHDISPSHISSIQGQFPNHILFSEVNDDTKLDEYDVLIVDNIGKLKTLYNYSDVAFVGGGFSNKLHNILEPAVFSNVILFGDDHSKFPEAEELIDAGGAFEITSGSELITFFENIASKREELLALQETSFNFIENNTGATKKLLDAVLVNLKV